MPLGNLSCEQLQKAYATLNNLSSIINSNDDKVKKEKCIEITNKFYTLIPHDFGMKTPQLINSKEILNVQDCFNKLKITFSNYCVLTSCLSFY